MCLLRPLECVVWARGLVVSGDFWNALQNASGTLHPLGGRREICGKLTGRSNWAKWVGGDTRLCGSWGHPLPPPGALALTSGEMAEVTPSYMLPLLPCSFRLPRDLVRTGLSPCPAPC